MITRQGTAFPCWTAGWNAVRRTSSRAARSREAVPEEVETSALTTTPEESMSAVILTVP